MLDQVRAVLIDALNLEGQAPAWHRDTPLLGSVPELDSLAVMTVITALEERFDLQIADDDISAEDFATLGSLVDFVSNKIAQSRAKPAS
jgi:acyl carrier protein